MSFSWQNVVDGNGIGITLTGMLIVFAGLALISLFIARLPTLLRLWDGIISRKQRAKKATPAPRAAADQPVTEAEIMAAVALALHLELERTAGDRQKITISRKKRGSIWNSAGKMRSLSQGGQHAQVRIDH